MATYDKVLKSAAAEPEPYKLCLVCGNIIDKNLEECAYCSGYRFDDNSEHVADAAIDLLMSPRLAVTDVDAFAHE